MGYTWSINQLKNHCHMMLKDHKLFKELIRCMGVKYDYNNTNMIQASATWWENKIKENPKYRHFKDHDCSEYYKTYSRYSVILVTPRGMQYCTKLRRRGFGFGSDSDKESPKDTVPLHDKGTDSSDGPTMGKVQSSMYVSGTQSGQKRKGRHSRGKGKEKKKRYGVRELSETIETLASMGNNLNSISLSCKALNDVTVEECIEELMSTGLIEDGGDVHMFALSFLTKLDNRKGLQAAKTPENKVKWIKWSFNRDLKSISSRN